MSFSQVKAQSNLGHVLWPQTFAVAAQQLHQPHVIHLILLFFNLCSLSQNSVSHITSASCRRWLTCLPEQVGAAEANMHVTDLVVFEMNINKVLIEMALSHG